MSIASRTIALLSLSILALALVAATAPDSRAQTPPELSGPERIEADVSTRSVSITSSFVGTEIIVFGTVENSRQPSAEAGFYDVIVVVEGDAAPLILRKRASIGGLWINTKQTRFASLPSFYAITSTRPIGEIAEPKSLNEHQIGFEHVRIVDSPTGRIGETTAEDLEEYRQAILRLKQADNLYVQSDYGVIFVGRSLFRATIEVPPNVPVGALKTRIYLYRNGELLDEYSGKVALARAGIERFLHREALERPFIYGILTVLMAVAAGLGSAYAFNRSG